MVDVVRQGWQWLTGSAPRPDRRSTMVLGVGTVTVVVLVLGLSLIGSGPARSALSKQRSAAQPSGLPTLAPTSTMLPDAGGLATTSPSQVAPLPAATTSTKMAKGTAVKTARQGPSRNQAAQAWKAPSDDGLTDATGALVRHSVGNIAGNGPGNGLRASRFLGHSASDQYAMFPHVPFDAFRPGDLNSCNLHGSGVATWRPTWGRNATGGPGRQVHSGWLSKPG